MSKVTYEVEGKEYRLVEAQQHAVLLQGVRKSDKRVVSSTEFSQARLIIRHEQKFGCRVP